MAASSGSRLVLHPERCNRCRACVRACPKGAIRVTEQHLWVDSRACDVCGACVDACAPRAIEAVAALQAVGPRGASLVVGSRSEVKALRRQAVEANKRAEKQEKSARKQLARVERADERAAAVNADGLAEWTIGDAGIIAGVLLVLLLVKNALFAARWLKLMPVDAAVWARVAVLLLFYGAQFVALGGLAKRHGLTIRAAFGLGRLGRGWRSRAVSAGLVVALLVATRAVTTLYGALAQRVGWQPPVAVPGDFIDLFTAGWPGFVAAFLLIALLGPITEELVFRGIIEGSLVPWGPWVAILGSTAIFALYHLNVWWLVPNFVLGLALGWLAWDRRGLWPPIALHVLYNAVAVVAGFWVASGR